MDAEIDEISNSINEHQTRKELIDPVLRKIGWIDKYIKEEVNSVKSDFNEKRFVLFSVDNIEKSVDRFIDYILLDEDFTVLAIIESKRYVMRSRCVDMENF